MKKLIQLMVIFIIFIPVIVNAEVCDVDKIYISSIEVEKSSDNVEEKQTDAAGREIILLLGMKEVGDNIEYKVIVKNDSNEDYELNKDSFKSQSGYFDYSISSKDNSFIVKANSSKEIRLKVSYRNQVPEDGFKNGMFMYEENLAFNLATEDKINNPNTGVRIVLLIFTIVLFLVIFTLAIINKKKYIKYLVLIGLLVIPTSVYAICKCDITVKSFIIVSQEEKPTQFCYTYEGEDHYFDYVSGMTWGQYIYSPLNNDYIQYVSGSVQPYGISSTFNCNTFMFNNVGIIADEEIQSSEVGCYEFELETCK